MGEIDTLKEQFNADVIVKAKWREPTFDGQLSIVSKSFNMHSDAELTLSQTTNCRVFQTERVCRRQFQVDKNGSKLSEWVENTAGKGEIARYGQFLLFPHYFQKTCTADTKKPEIVWKRIRFMPLTDDKT